MTEMTDSTVLHVKVRIMVSILKKEVAMKLIIQLASLLNLIWRSVVALAFSVRLVDLHENFPLGIKLSSCYLHVSLQIAVDFICKAAQVQR